MFLLASGPSGSHQSAMRFRITYNSPVILTFALLAIAVHGVDSLTPGQFTREFFSLPGRFHWTSPLDWVRLVTWPFGHADWSHLAGNLVMVLVIGPLIEEKYGSSLLMEMALITTLVTAVLNLLLFHAGLMGMSGLVFMLIVLSSVTNLRGGQIPLTFLLVAGLFLGREVIDAFHADRISQFAHILGGICGSVFGFLSGKKPASV